MSKLKRLMQKKKALFEEATTYEARARSSLQLAKQVGEEIEELTRAKKEIENQLTTWLENILNVSYTADHPLYEKVFPYEPVGVVVGSNTKEYRMFADKVITRYGIILGNTTPYFTVENLAKYIWENKYDV